MMILALEKEIVSSWKPSAEAATTQRVAASNGKVSPRLRMMPPFRIGSPSRRPNLAPEDNHES